MTKQMLKSIVLLSMVSLLLVGCGGKEIATDNDSRIETNIVENETSSQGEITEDLTPTPEPTETPTPTPEPTETPTPTPEPTETPTPTPEPTETPAAESTETPTHQHNYVETITTEALCNTTGVKQYSCSCGYSYTEEYIDTHNHQADGNPRVLKESDCIHRGIYGEICLRCGLYVNSKTLELTDHIAVSYWVYFPEQNLYCLGCANCNYTIQETSVKPEGVEIKEATPYYFD